jgi:hypothetical protein
MTDDVSLKVGVVDDTQQTLQQMVSDWKQSGDKLADALSKTLSSKLTETDRQIEQIGVKAKQYIGGDLIRSFTAAV